VRVGRSESQGRRSVANANGILAERARPRLQIVIVEARHETLAIAHVTENVGDLGA